MRRGLSILATFLLCVLLMAGCGDSSNDGQTISQKADVQMEAWICYDRNVPGAYYAFLWDTLAEQYGYQVEIHTYSRQELENKLKMAMVCNELPDIFYVPGGTYPEFLFEAGACLPIQGYLEKHDYLEEYRLPWEDGNNYLIPCNPESYGVTYYDRELMEKLGVEIPSNWQELLEMVQKVNQYNEENGTDYAAIELGMKDNWMGELLQCVIAQQSDPEEYHKMGETGVFSQDVFEESGAKIQYLINAGAFPKDFLEIGEPEAVKQFINHKAVMMVHQSSLIYHLAQNMGKDGFVLDVFPSCNESYEDTRDQYLLELNHTYKPGLAVSSRSRYQSEAVTLCLEFSNQVNQINVVQYGYLNMSEDGIATEDENGRPWSDYIQRLHELTENTIYSDGFLGAIWPQEIGDTWGNLTKKFFAREINLQDYIMESQNLADVIRNQDES